MYVEISRAADCITMALCHRVNIHTADYEGKIIYCSLHCRQMWESVQHLQHRGQHINTRSQKCHPLLLVGSADSDTSISQGCQNQREITLYHLKSCSNMTNKSRTNKRIKHAKSGSTEKTKIKWSTQPNNGTINCGLGQPLTHSPSQRCEKATVIIKMYSEA